MLVFLSLKGFVVSFLVCFSIIRNTTKIMNCSVPAGTISAINGIRVLSMWWVILGHTYLWLIIYRTLSESNFNSLTIMIFNW